jgi:hypothetical protein
VWAESSSTRSAGGGRWGLRDLVRARYDAKVDLLRARHRLTKFLLRQGVYPPQGVKQVGSIRREPSRTSMRFQLATLVRGSSVTAHCPAAPALPTREYQADYRRQSLTSEATCATPLDNSFHIRGAAEKPGRIFGAEGAPRRSLGS